MTRILRFVNLFGRICLLISILIRPVLAVEKFKISNCGRGQQIWFEAEDFDKRSKSKKYRLGKKEKAIKTLGDVQVQY